MLAARLTGRGLAGLLLALGAAMASAAVAGSLVAPMLSPNARALIVAAALVTAGVGAVIPARIADTAGRSTSPLAGFIEGLALAVGDRATFLVFALAVRGPSPTLAGVGGATAVALVAIAAQAVGEAGFRRLPLRPLVMAAGIALLGVGIFIALSALRLT